MRFYGIEKHRGITCVVYEALGDKYYIDKAIADQNGLGAIKKELIARGAPIGQVEKLGRLMPDERRRGNKKALESAVNHGE